MAHSCRAVRQKMRKTDFSRPDHQGPFALIPQSPEYLKRNRYYVTGYTRLTDGLGVMFANSLERSCDSSLESAEIAFICCGQCRVIGRNILGELGVHTLIQ